MGSGASVVISPAGPMFSIYVGSQTSDVSMFSRRGPPTSRPLPWDQFFIPSRFLTVPRPGEGLPRPKTRKNLRLDFLEAPE
eukprot:7880854-Pyramimonas_sp.AAC.1